MRLITPKIVKLVLVSIEVVTVSVSLMLLSSSNPPFQRVYDDSDILYQFLEKQQGKQVLGASSTTEEDACPDSHPIIGWINYAGVKQIRQYLPPDATASACFSSVPEANAQGYFEVSE